MTIIRLPGPGSAFRDCTIPGSGDSRLRIQDGCKACLMLVVATTAFHVACYIVILKGRIKREMKKLLFILFAVLVLLFIAGYYWTRHRRHQREVRLLEDI